MEPARTSGKALKEKHPLGQIWGSGCFTEPDACRGMEPVSSENIAFIHKWIDDGCPEDLFVRSQPP